VISVERFETSADGQAQLKARWIIKDAANDEDLYASETIVSSSVTGGGASAASALSEDLTTLSREIAARVSYLREHRRTGS
jgi:hypothetical protein